MDGRVARSFLEGGFRVLNALLGLRDRVRYSLILEVSERPSVAVSDVFPPAPNRGGCPPSECGARASALPPLAKRRSRDITRGWIRGVLGRVSLRHETVFT